MTEASKILPRIIDLLKGKTVLDLGCGEEKIVPWAVGVDDGSEWDKLEPEINASIAKNGGRKDLTLALLRTGNPTYFDVVFSSHVVEHCQAPIRDTLYYWLSFLKWDGLLILYLPDENHYIYDPNNPKARNPAHHHFLTPETFRWHLEQIPNLVIELFEPDIGDDRYSFLVVARKSN